MEKGIRVMKLTIKIDKGIDLGEDRWVAAWKFSNESGAMYGDYTVIGDTKDEVEAFTKAFDVFKEGISKTLEFIKDKGWSAGEKERQND